MDGKDRPPARRGRMRRGRVYRITDAGDRSLIEWIEELEQTREEIDQLIRVYRSRDSG
jgi:DNA-binding PadR family transcriptional regulator